MEAEKKKRQSSGRKSAHYDKIFKENTEAVISSIMQNVLKITAISMQELPDDRGGRPLNLKNAYGQHRRIHQRGKRHSLSSWTRERKSKVCYMPHTRRQQNFRANRRYCRDYGGLC